jgi:CRP-like cAMP-binding protein
MKRAGTPATRRRSGMSSTMGSNRLLAGLSASDRGLLEPYLEEVWLNTGQVIERPNQRISHVHFLTSGLVSVVGTTRVNQRIEVGMVGFEGMTGLAIVLGHDSSTNETLVQAKGMSLRIQSADLQRALRASPSLTAALLRYVHVFMMQSSQTALANGRAKLAQRLARWLLMWNDRLQTPHLIVTHEFLALLIGVRRQGVTVALHELEGQGLIKGTRNQITVVDRKGLLALAEGFYSIPEEEYAKTIRKRPAARRRAAAPA